MNYLYNFILNNSLNYLLPLLYYIGEYSYLFIFLTSFLMLQNKLLFSFYVFLCIILIVLLKVIVKDKRPEPLYLNSPNQYGFPSGHSFINSFMTIYTYMNTENINLLFLQTIITIITMLQRVITKKHYIYQVIYGLLFGSIYSFFLSF